jgi:hypothetical protein
MKLKAIFAILLVAALASSVIAQSGSGIYGRILYPEISESITEVSIAIYNLDNVLIASTITESDNYRFQLPPGQYRLKVESRGQLVLDTSENPLTVTESRYTYFDIKLQAPLVADAAPEEETEKPAIQSDLTKEIVELMLPPGTLLLEVKDLEGNLLTSKQLIVSSNAKEANLPEALIQGLVRARSPEPLQRGQGLANCTIEAVEIDTGRKYSTTSNEIGSYQISLPAGRYDLSAKLGTSETELKNLSLRPGNPSTWNPQILLTDNSDSVETPLSYSMQVGPTYGERHTIYLNIRESGPMALTYSWQGDAEQLTLLIKGPDGKTHRISGKSPLSYSSEIAEDSLSRDSQWEISVINYAGGQAEGSLILRRLK